MVTGRQIREARAVLGLTRSALAARVRGVTTATIMRAELIDGEPSITTAQADAIKEALERAGVEFTSDPPSVRLRKAQP